MSGTETFVLELLPARGLDQSMLLPVLVGLLVVLFFTETLGWVFAGAVVPGYLASVLVIQPATGAIVIFESLVTLAISASLAKLLSRTDAWTRFFGRERFFLILAISLIVRMHDHAWFAPWAIAHVDEALGTQLEIQQEFYSVGLVLVPLTANMLWKPAIHRGLLQLAVQVAITYVLVRHVLLPYTNLSLSSVELTYENAAINFVGHAKAYIILLTAALLAAQFNLTYGWDFNGILVPALLALLWLTPLKLLATVGEAMIVFWLVKGFLRLPVIRHLDFAGSRKLVLVFTLAFFWKLGLGFALTPIFPELKISDTYGFGYLLSSLLAVKMLSVKSVRAVLLPSLTASAGGFLIGSAAGFLLDLAAPEIPPRDPITRPASQRLSNSPLGVASLARMQIAAQREDPRPPSQAELRQLRVFWAEVAQLDRTLARARRGKLADLIASVAGEHEVSLLDPLRRRGAGLGLQIVELGSYPVGPERHDPLTALAELQGPARVDLRQRRDWYAVVEQGGPNRRGFGSGLVVPGAEGPVLVVPMPAEEAPIAEGAVLACRRVDCRAVLIAGRELGQTGNGINPRPLEIAVAAFDAEQVVVLRADPGGDAGIVSRVLPDTKAPTGAGRGAGPSPAGGGDEQPSPARIHPLRGHFDLVELWPDYELDWEPRETVIRPPPGEGDFVLLETTPAQLEAMLIEGADELERIPTRPQPDPITTTTAAPKAKGDGSSPASEPSELLARLAAIHEHREPPGLTGSGYEPPSEAELLLLEQDIVGPLVDWAQSSAPGVPPPATVALWAAELGYESLELGDCRGVNADGTYRPCLVMLHDRDRPSTAGWGTLVVRRDPQALPVIIEVPRPHRELQTWRVGAELWQLSRASALLIAGADGLPRTPLSETADLSEDDPQRSAPNPDPVRAGNLGTPFQAFHEAIDRSSVRGRAREVVQIRGLASYRPVDRDLILGVGQPAKAGRYDEACWAALDEQLAALVSTWGSCQIADGSVDLYLLSGAGTPQLEYSRELRKREVRVLWLSAGLRERFAANRGFAELRGLRQTGFSHEVRREVEALLLPLWPAETGPGPHGEIRRAVGKQGFDAAVEVAVAYAETGNLHLLRELRFLRDSATDLRVEAGVGQDWGRPFLLIEWAGERLGERALISLDHTLDRRVELSAAEFGDDAIARLQVAALGRPQVLLISDILVVGGQP